jgi:hypothetical protein
MDRRRVKAAALDIDHNDGTYIERSVNSVVLAVERGIPCFATSPRRSVVQPQRNRRTNRVRNDGAMGDYGQFYLVV